MFNLGVASSVAKEYDYSWQHTADIAASFNLTALQLYLHNTDSIEYVPGVTRFNQIYLHLPDIAYKSAPAVSDICIKFRNYYSSNNLIIHQPHLQTAKGFIDGLDELVDKGFRIGIENHKTTDLHAYFELLQHIKGKGCYYAVMDIHKFFYNFYQNVDLEVILETLRSLLHLCKKENIGVVLHLIDSISYSGGREFWQPIFNGILPYRDIFDYILDRGIEIEAVIFEYENEAHIQQSVKHIQQLFKRDQV